MHVCKVPYYPFRRTPNERIVRVLRTSQPVYPWNGAVYRFGDDAQLRAFLLDVHPVSHATPFPRYSSARLTSPHPPPMAQVDARSDLPRFFYFFIFFVSYIVFAFMFCMFLFCFKL